MTEGAPAAKGASREPPPQALLDEVAALSKRGEHAAAAAALWGHGYPAPAALLYEQIFEHARALAAYEAAGDLVGAVRMAVEVPDPPALDRLVTVAITSSRGDELLAHLKRAGRAAEEARVHLARGDLVAAADAFERAGQLDKAARVLEDAGKVREAGLLLERHLEAHPTDVDAGIRLGRVLARFGRHDDAIRVLQGAVAHAGAARDAAVVQASPTMMMSFVQLGYDHGAREVIRRWAAAHARAPNNGELEPPPASLEAFLASDRVAALVAIQAKPQGTKPPQQEAAARDADALFGTQEGAVDVDAPAPLEERAATLDDTLLLGGRYLLGEPLGGGGMGQVFRAFDAFSDRPVAVKIFGAQVIASEAVKEYAREARAFAELRHPAVTALIELNVAQGFAVTELVQAPSIEDKLLAGGAGGWLAPAIKALLDLLATAHRAGLVHGALKPTNVFALDAGVRVVDVGAHRLLALRSTETGGLASVWAYLAPEQLFGAPASAQGDLYSVGAMLYRAVTGRPPFLRAEEDRRLPPPLASTVNPAVNAAWDAFLARALAPDAAERFADADELARAMPPLPAGMTLPAAPSLMGGAAVLAVESRADRYAKGALVDRPREGVRVYEGTDLALDRRVWLVDADDFSALKPFVVCARLWRGVQPIYDVLPEAARVVLARDAGDPVDLASLRAVPQGLARDLAGVASAVEWLHAQGWAVGGFETARARVSVGLRLKLAPAPVLVEETPALRARDWVSFGALVDEAFDLEPDPTLDGRGRLLAMLHDRRLLDRADLEALGAEAEALSSWARFLEAIAARLVQGASARVVARMVASVLRGG